jgi:type II secretory pathway component GspD/PulD (secretin)
MRTCTWLLVLLSLCLHGLCGDEPVEEPAEQTAHVLPRGRQDSGPGTRSTTVYRLKHLAAKDAARALNEKLGKQLDTKPRHDGIVLDSPVVVVPDEASNTLLISAEAAYAGKIAATIQKLDAQPQFVAVRCRISRIDAGGRAEVLSRPRIMTIDGQTAVVEISGGQTDRYKFELTPHIVTPDRGRGSEPE